MSSASGRHTFSAMLLPVDRSIRHTTLYFGPRGSVRAADRAPAPWGFPAGVAQAPQSSAAATNGIFLDIGWFPPLTRVPDAGRWNDTIQPESYRLVAVMTTT